MHDWFGNYGSGGGATVGHLTGEVCWIYVHTKTKECKKGSVK